MHQSAHPRGRVRLKTAALLPVTVVAWLTLGTTSSFAAPSSHAAAGASASAAATATSMAAPTGTAANGKGQDKGNGKGNGKDQGSAQATGSGNDSSDHSSGNAGTSGDPTQPQPPSTADQNSGGANGQCPGGPYCSTRDGSPSGNGNGGGQAKGKPCAGCVGKADNKNPKGQMPNGSDHNNGYECDGNNGIGKTNPAHTGCQSTPPPPNCEDTNSCPPPPCEQTNTCEPPPCDETTEDCGNPPPCEQTNTCEPPPCDETTEDCGNPPPCDEATEECTPPPPCDVEAEDCTPNPECVPTAENHFCSTVEGEHHTRKPPTKVLGEKVTRTPSVLPFTGAAGIGFMVGVAGVALAVGGGLMVATRRRREHVG